LLLHKVVIIVAVIAALLRIFQRADDGKSLPDVDCADFDLTLHGCLGDAVAGDCLGNSQAALSFCLERRRIVVAAAANPS